MIRYRLRLAVEEGFQVCVLLVISSTMGMEEPERPRHPTCSQKTTPSAITRRLRKANDGVICSVSFFDNNIFID
jgi:hypothetical protein